ERVAVVSHSQGGALAHEAFRDERPKNLALLVTFGSGLRKLEELRQFLRSGRSFRRSAALTLLGLVVTAPSLIWLGMLRLGWLRLSEEHDAWGVVSLVLWSIVGLGLVLAGLWDFVSGLDTPQLRRSCEALRSAGLRWMDRYASADPVPNGPVFDDETTLDHD